ncbi:MAG: response regulator transcription factor [Candidatus Velthaea sp.]
MVSLDRVPSLPLIDCSEVDNAGLASRCKILDLPVYATTLDDFLARSSERRQAIVVATNDTTTVQRIRRATEAPLIVLDHEPRDGAAVKMFACGADDYVPAPCRHDEVVARITAVLRRVRMWPVTVHDLHFDPSTRVVRRKGKTIALTPTESAIICTLAENRGNVVSREDHVRLAARHGARLRENSVPVVMHHLRKKIDVPFSEPLIHCIPFSGYFVGRYRQGLPPARATARKVAIG